MVVRAQKDAKTLDLSGLVSQDAPGGRLFHRRQERRELPRAVGAGAGSLSLGALLHSDFWKAYGEVILEERHEAVGKKSGETAHIERWNNTLRQRLSRFVRMTLSFSKSDRMHELCLRLFLHRYNLSHLP